MVRRGWRIGALVAVLAVGTLLFLDRYLLSAREDTSWRSVFTNSTGGSVSRLTRPTPTSSSARKPSSQSTTPNSQSSVKAFEGWLSDTARQMNEPSRNSDAKNQELTEVASNLTPEQRKRLLQVAQTAASPVAERILSAYLLVEGGALSQSELKDLATTPLDNPGPHETHSIDEVRNMQDKSLRVMAIDGLAERAKTDPSARQLLAQAADDVQDPYLRAYARRRLDEISQP